MTNVQTIDDWLNAAVSTANELATVALGFESVEILGKGDSIPANLNSAMIALVSDSASVQLGIASTKEGCQALARALLAMDPDEEDLPEEDVADAIGEVANIVAGQVKSAMSETDASLRIGLPLFVQGRVDYSDEVESAVADLNIGPVPVTFIVLKSVN